MLSTGIFVKDFEANVCLFVEVIIDCEVLNPLGVQIVIDRLSLADRFPREIRIMTDRN